MLDSIVRDIKITYKRIFGVETSIFFHLLDFYTTLYLLPLCNITNSVNY